MVLLAHGTYIVLLVSKNNLFSAITGFHMCQVHEISPRGTNVKTIQTNPVYTDYSKANYPTIVSRILFEMCKIS